MTSMISPCVLVCIIEEKSGCCIGCGRSREEIAGWTGFSEAGRRAVMDALPARMASLGLDAGNRPDIRTRELAAS